MASIAGAVVCQDASVHRGLFAFLVTVAVLASCGGRSTPETRNSDSAVGHDSVMPFAERVATGGVSYDDTITEGRESIQAFWSALYPATYGVAFREISVVEGMRPGDEVECDSVVLSYRDVKDTVRYCPDDDAVVFDDGQLFPDLYERFGPLGVGAVLAGTWGKAIQSRAGLSESDLPSGTLALQVDCFAGAWVGHAASDPSWTANDAPGALDAALAGYLTVRDRSVAPQSGAHVSAFDRVGAFGDGLDGGVASCTAYADPTSAPVASMLPSERAAVVDGETLDHAVEELADELNMYWQSSIPGFEPIVTLRGVDRIERGACSDPGITATLAAPVAYCETLHGVVYDESFLDAGAVVIGKGALAAWLGDAWARAAAVALGFTVGDDARGAAFDCLNGAWAGDAFSGRRTDVALGLGTADLDAVAASIPVTQRLHAGSSDASSFDRIEVFRAGFHAIADDASTPADACARFR